jgi:hypothetical protein
LALVVTDVDAWVRSYAVTLGFTFEHRCTFPNGRVAIAHAASPVGTIRLGPIEPAGRVASSNAGHDAFGALWA